MTGFHARMLTYKEAVRHVWNTYFLQHPSPLSPEAQEAFVAVEKGLFDALVRPEGGKVLVQPARELREIPMLLEDGKGGYTRIAAVAVQPGSRLVFDRFFDWSWAEPLDLAYVKVRVEALLGQPECVGKYAIIEQVHCVFVCGE